MSEIKPVAFVNPTDIDQPFTPSGFAIIEIRERSEHSYTAPLYTSEQLAEAVAAERERCAKACEGERLGDVASDPTDISYAVAVERCIHAIRSAAK
ncbi:hypothetical protein [Gluconobacter oxydans]|uniref:hypothetical protein n=1 Tax=Gluconobacter oxydans TaxID=442 RepID=UPI003463B680